MLALIQMTLRRRGLPLVESDEEIVFELGIWRDALEAVPDAHLQRAYSRAAAAWDWLNPRRPFTPDAVAAAYVDLVVEAREEDEKERREAAFRNPDRAICPQCADNGYASVFMWSFNRWYVGLRPCFCSATPPEQRAEPLLESAYERDQLGRFVRREDLARYGPPDSMFKAFQPQTEKKTEEN